MLMHLCVMLHCWVPLQWPPRGILRRRLQELAIARSGQTSDPSAGRRAMDATFGSDCDFRMGYLTKQSAAWAVLVSSGFVRFLRVCCWSSLFSQLHSSCCFAPSQHYAIAAICVRCCSFVCVEASTLPLCSPQHRNQLWLLLQLLLCAGHELWQHLPAERPGEAG